MKKIYFICLGLLIGLQVINFINYYHKQDRVQELVISVEQAKQDSSLFISDEISSSYITVQQNAMLVIGLTDKDIIYVNMNKGEPVSQVPYTVKMKNHIMMIYKKGKYIGCYGYYKKPFEFDQLQLL